MTPLEKIHARCTECGDCLLWQGCTNGAGQPKLHNRSARRAVYELAKGTVPAHLRISNTCGQVMCLAPNHMEARTVGEITKINNARPAVRLKRRASSAKSNRPTLGKITMDIARELRNSNRPGIELAKELGVSPSLVSHVRRGRSWVEHSSPFAGLLA